VCSEPGPAAHGCLTDGVVPLAAGAAVVGPKVSVGCSIVCV
jgi:hypothetical protein